MTVIYGLILSGGQGNRLQKQDKGLIQFAGGFLVQRVIRSLAPQVNQIVISANRNISQYEALGYEVFEDDLDEFAGPLAGLYKAMEVLAAREERPDLLVVAPCDAPLLPSNLVDRLLVEYTKGDILAVIPHDGTYLQPLFGLYSMKVLLSLKDYLEKGNRKVSLWVESLPHRVVDFSDNKQAFLNINSATDLDEANRLLG